MDFETLSLSENRYAILEKSLLKANAHEIPHSKDTLFKHLINVSHLLQKWGLDSKVSDAGLFHSVYSTEAFPIEVFNHGDREILKNLIGEKAEKLVYLFCSARRDSIKFTRQQWQCVDRWTNEIIFLTESQVADFFHIMLADHLENINGYNFFTVRNQLKIYKQILHLLNDKAKESFFSFLPQDKKINFEQTGCKLQVRFIAHSGVEIKSAQHTLLLDPWLLSSDFEEPVMHGFIDGNRTIDFAVPEVLNSVDDFSPDIILLSHFHTHHAPAKELKAWLKAKQKLVICCPAISDKSLSRLKDSLGELFDRIEFIFFSAGIQKEIYGFDVKAFENPQVDHLAWLVKSADISIVHIADSSLHTEASQSKQMDKVWLNMKALKPDILFIGCSSSNVRYFKHTQPSIFENTSLTPIQAAQITQLIEPRVVVPVGFYNSSIWKNRLEYSSSSAEIEQQFYWATSFLNPNIQCFNLKPSNTFEFYEKNGLNEIFLVAAR